MEITPKLRYVEGSFDTRNCKMLCIASDNHGTVELCVNEPGSNWNIPIGEIKLYNSGLYVDFKATMPDAKKLGDEISRRFNEFPEDQKQ